MLRYDLTTLDTGTTDGLPLGGMLASRLGSRRARGFGHTSVLAGPDRGGWGF